MMCAEAHHQDEAHLAAILDLGAETVEGFGHLRQQGTLLDLNVKVGDVIFKAHKAYMAAISVYFRGLLTEHDTGGPVTVELEGVAAEDIQVVFDFLYDQRLTLSLSNVRTVLHVAAHLQVEVLAVRCSNFLIKSLNKENLLEILDIAKSYHLTEVHQDVLTFVAESWTEMKDTLVKLTKEDLISLLDAPFFCDAEVCLFTIAKNWVEASADNFSCIGEVMSSIKFPLMSEKDLEEITEFNDFLKTGPCESLIEEARAYHKMSIAEKVIVNTKRSKVRGVPRNIVFSTGYSTLVGANDFMSPYVLDISSSLSYRWVGLPNVMEPLGVASVLFVNNFVIACGVGRFLSKGDSVKNDCAIFDPRTYKWCAISSMKDARIDFPLVALSENIYALGGSTKWRSVHPINAAEVFNYKENKWSSVSNMPEALTNHAACESGGKIYVCGGLGMDEAVSAGMWMYDPGTDTWSDLPKMQSAEQGHSLLPLVPGKLFMVSATSGEISTFTLDTNQWTTLTIDQDHTAPSEVAVVEYTPLLSVVSWVKDMVGDEANAAAGDSEQAHPIEEVEHPVQFVNEESFKSPWLTRRIWDFPEGVHWRHCGSLTIPWSVLSQGKVERELHGNNVMLELLQNMSLA